MRQELKFFRTEKAIEAEAEGKVVATLPMAEEQPAPAPEPAPEPTRLTEPKTQIVDNAKTSSNTVGTALLTNGVMPTSTESTRYVLYKDVNYGNAASSKSISLSPGSKLVPNGGLPKVVDEQGNYLSPMPVEGGELSWVHSTDIGMIQDGALPKGMTRAQVGEHNANVLRIVAASRWNLILDGTYYVNVGIKPGKGTRELVVEKAVTLRRPLRIKGGGLIAECNLFCVEAGGGLVLEDVTLDNLNSYGMIYLDPWGGLIESVELYRCKLKTSTSKSIGKFITASSKNVGPTDTVNDYTPDGIGRTFNAASGVKFLGLPSEYIDTAGKSHNTWGLKSATAKVPTQNLCYYEGYNSKHPYFPGDKNAVWADAWCCYDQGSQLYVPYDNGENDMGAYVFRERKGTPGGGGSTIKHKGMQGDFVLETTTRNTDVLYKENGKVVHFRPLYLHDDLVDGELVLKTANPEVDHNGMRKFIVDGCSIMTRSTVFLIGGLAVEEEFRVSNNLFYDIGYLTMNFGTDNDSEASDEWNYRSCPFEVYGNTFRGVGYVVESNQPYAGVMLYEGNTILFHDNVVENIITTTNTYDSYLSCAKVEFRNNVIRNVLKWKNKNHSLYGYFKAKGARVGFNYAVKYGGDKMNHPRKLSRLYEGNLYEENMKDIRQMCDSYMQKYRSIYFPTYADTAWEDIPQDAKDDVLKENVLRTMFDNVVSPWSFDTFTIRNNIFDMPDCALNGSASSGGSAKLRRFILDGNVFKFREFCSSPSNGYNHYLFVIDPTSEGAEAEITGNTFESKGNEIINVLDVLGTGGSETFKSFRVEDNKFVNCGYRISQGPNFNGLINAESIRILGNKESAGLDDGYEIHACKLDDCERNMYGYTYLQYASGYNVLGKDNSNYKLQGVPIRYNGPGTFEFWDSQKNGVPANAGKFFRLPVDKSRVIVKSTHMCRPAPSFADAEADKNPSARYSTHIRTVANTETFTITDIEDCPVGVEVTIECGSVSRGVKIEQSGCFANISADWIPAVGDRIVLKKTMTWEWQIIDGVKTKKYNWSFSEVSRSTAAQHANVIDLPDYFAERSIAFAYELKDVKGYCVTVRYRLNGVWKEKKAEFRCIKYTDTARGVSARGADGCRFANYKTGNTVKYFEFGGIKELGMHFALRHFNLGLTTVTSGSWICLNIFTDDGGTKNDPDSEMTIEICDTTGNADVGRTVFTYGDTSPFETFLPKGSTLSAAERTALLTGDVSAYNMLPQSDTVVRKCTLTAADTGWWCKDSKSGETVVWLGSKWSDDSATIRASQLWSGTQAQYDALTAEQKASIIAFIEESYETT